MVFLFEHIGMLRPLLHACWSRRGIFRFKKQLKKAICTWIAWSPTCNKHHIEGPNIGNLLFGDSAVKPLFLAFSRYSNWTKWLCIFYIIGMPRFACSGIQNAAVMVERHWKISPTPACVVQWVLLWLGSFQIAFFVCMCMYHQSSDALPITTLFVFIACHSCLYLAWNLRPYLQNSILCNARYATSQAAAPTM